MLSSTWEQSINYSCLDPGCNGRRVGVCWCILGFEEGASLLSSGASWSCNCSAFLQPCSAHACLCLHWGEKPILLTWQRFPVVKPTGYRQFCCQLSAESCCCCWLNLLPSPSVNAAFTQLTQAVRNELILYLVSSSLYHTQTTQSLWECLKDL